MHIDQLGSLRRVYLKKQEHLIAFLSHMKHWRFVIETIRALKIMVQMKYSQIHPDAKELFNVNGNLRKVCETLRDPKVRLNEIEITIFNPFKPVKPYS